MNLPADQHSFAGPAESMQARTSFSSQWMISLLLAATVFFCVAEVSTVLQLARGVLWKPRLSTAVGFNGGQFESCDRLSGIKFSSQNRCEIRKSGHVTHANYTMLSAGQVNLVSIIRGYLRRREIWYRYDPSGIIDKDGVVFYSLNSPEFDVVRRMWWYANFAQEYYKESRLYPFDTQKCKQSDSHFQYTNPFTGSADYASVALKKGTDSVIDLTSRGKGNRHWRPGAIFCLCVNYQQFLVQGFDGNGRPLISSDPSRYFVIECQNGIDITKLQQTQSQNQGPFDDNQTPVQVILYEYPGLQESVQWLRLLFQLSAWSFAGIALLWLYISHKRNFALKVRLGSIIAATASMLCLIAWYALALWTST